MLENVTREIIAFRDARDWKRFHSPKNLSASIAIEAAELLEIFQWIGEAEMEAAVRDKRAAISDEMADVLIYLLILAHDLGIDPAVAIREKMLKNAAKYPAPPCTAEETV